MIKGQINTVFFTLVDDTGAPVILTASALNSTATRYLIGVDNGASGATSTITITKDASVVRSALYKQIFQADEMGMDTYAFGIEHASIADQIIPFQLSDYSMVSNYLSQISTLLSDVESQVDLNASLASDAHSAAAQANSRTLVIQSVLSDVDSALSSQFVYVSNALSDMQSDIRSYLIGMSGMLSDVDSQLLLNASMISDVQSNLTVVRSMASDAHSAATLAAARALTTQSIASDAHSAIVFTRSMVSDIDSQLDITASKILLMQSMLSDVDSQLTLTDTAMDSQYSDLASKVGAVTATISASDISDIVSGVWGAKYADNSLASSFGSLFSVLATDAAAGASIALVVQSMISDIDSQLTVTDTAMDSQYSDLASKIGNVSVTLTASDISDIASAVIAAGAGVDASVLSDILSAAQQTNSRVFVVQSMVSDVDSQLLLNASALSDVQSALDSQFAVVSNYLSNISALVSDVDSQLTVTDTALDSQYSDLSSKIGSGNVSVLSDILSAAQQTNSRALVIQSMVSDVDSQLLLNASALSDVQSALDSQFVYMSAVVSDLDSQVDLNASLASDAHSAAAQANSRTLVLESSLSDIESQLDVTHSLLSDVESAVDATPGLILTRNLANDGYGNTRNVQNALRFSRNKFNISGSVLNVYEEDDTTVAWSAAVSTASGNPVVDIDP